MNEILIIEDNGMKEARIISALKSSLDGLDFTSCQTIKVAYPMLERRKWDLVLLDMSFQVNADTGRETKKKPLAGRQILQFMRAKGLKCPVIVVTQHSSFSEGQTTIESVDDLHRKFRQYFPENYRATVFVDLAANGWHQTLIDEVKRALHEH